ncbi:hypothetical protein K8I28_00535 [bacterium]|nr:hypothetical protein [bacterium]
MFSLTKKGTMLLLLCVVLIPFGVNAEWVQFAMDANLDSKINHVGTVKERINLVWQSEGVEIDQTEEGMIFSMPGEGGMSLDLQRPVYSGLVRLPWGRLADVEVTGGEFVRYDAIAGMSDPASLAEVPQEIKWVDLGESAIFRDLTIAPLSIHPVQPDENGAEWIATRLEMTVVVDGPMPDVSAEAPNRPISRDFHNLYKELIVNDELDDLGARLAETKGSLMIVAHNQFVPRLTNYIDWKKAKGFNVVLYTFDQSPTEDGLREEIRTQYATLDPPLEYVLLVGDHVRGGNTRIPSYFRIQNPSAPQENDVTDWPYAFIDGDDYMPELFIGRMAVGTASEALNASSRVVAYESDPFGPGNDLRFNKATIVAGNYSEGGATPYTPVATSELVAEKMREDWGIAEVDTIYWRTQTPNNPPIDPSINEGTMFVTYRGWGNATGWIRPEYYSNDVSLLENGGVLPVVTSFVCNTGDFGNANHNKCFAEYWISAGTYAVPTGAVSMIAPSDLHTKTKYNNPLIIGFYNGIYEDNLLNISAALLRAKMEIYWGHPTARGEDDLVEFYFSVYHVIGDPTLTMWRRTPRQLAVDIEDTIPLGQDYLDVTVAQNGNPKRDAYVNAVTAEGEIVTGRYTDASGSVSIPLSGVAAGELSIVVTSDDCEPIRETVTVQQMEQFLTVNSWSTTTGDMQQGETVELVFNVENSGTQAQNGVTVTLTHPGDGMVTIDPATVTIGDLGSEEMGDNTGQPISVTLNQMVPQGWELEFHAEVEGSAGGPFTSKIWIPVNATAFRYVDYEVANGSYMAGESASLNMTFENAGTADVTGVTATLTSWDDAVQVETAEVMLGDVPAGGVATTQVPFEVRVEGDTYNGRVVRFDVQFSNDAGVIGGCPLSIALEGVQSTDPLGPDAYGYFAYDDTDVNWAEAPTFEWFDLTNNNEAEVYEVQEDENVIINIPFDFTFYGFSSNTATVSSNGWMSLTEEENYTKYYFRNWHLPSGIGAKWLIAGFWDDLKSPQGEIFEIRTSYQDDKFIVEWSNAVSSWGHQNQDYHYAEHAIVLYDPAVYPTESGDGIIEIHYNRANDADQTNNGCTVGIENGAHTIGLEYTYALTQPAAAAPLQDQRAIRFTTNAPDNYEPIAQEDDGIIPEEFKLYPAFPNPFNSATELSFDVGHESHIKLAVYNMLGQEIARLVDRKMGPGHKTVSWDVQGLGLSSGLLMVRLEAEDFNAWSKMMYVK